MQTPWSHQAVREEFDEEIRLLISALREASTSDTDQKISSEKQREDARDYHARLLTLWSLALLYGPWMATPLDSHELHAHAARHFELLRRHRLTLKGHYDRDTNGQGSAFNPGGDNAIRTLTAVAHAAVAGIDGANEYLHILLEEQEKYWWEPRYGLISEHPLRMNPSQHPPTNTHGPNLPTNVSAIGVYVLAAEITGQRIWMDRARSIAYALNKSLPLTRLKAATLALHDPPKDGNTRPDHTSLSGIVAPIAIDEEAATYFLWTRNLLHLRAHLVDAGDEVPPWLLSTAWKLYYWARTASWYGDDKGFSPSCFHHPNHEESVSSPLSSFAEAVSAAEALGKTIEYLNGRDERLAQLSTDFAVAMTWADRHLRHAPGRWGATHISDNGMAVKKNDEDVQSLEELSKTLEALFTPLILARLPLAPIIPAALAKGRVAPLMPIAAG